MSYKKDRRNFWEKVKDDETGWFLAIPLFIMLAIGAITIFVLIY